MRDRGETEGKELGEEVFSATWFSESEKGLNKAIFLLALLTRLNALQLINKVL
jgi:hypothetical protein